MDILLALLEVFGEPFVELAAELLSKLLASIGSSLYEGVKGLFGW